MASGRFSPFDDLLADSKRQFDELQSGRAAPVVQATERPVPRPVQRMEPEPGAGQTVSGTANGIPFTVRPG